jgi:hypothetical protein
VRRATDWACRITSLLILIGAASAGPVSGQSEPLIPGTPGDPVLTVRSDPPGAIIRLRGEHEFVGRTPWNLHRPLSGVYTMEAFAPGYDVWERQVYLDPTAPQDIFVKLSRKSRLGAAARSLLIPGWGQRYNGAHTRGWFYTIAEVGAVGTTLVFWEIYQNQVDDFDEASERYRNARDEASVREARRDVIEADEDADDAYDRYRVALTVAGGIYVIALVDALFGPAPAYQRAARSHVDADPAPAPPSSLGFHADLARDGDAELGLRFRW